MPDAAVLRPYWVAIPILIIGASLVYQYLWWKLFTYIVSEDGVSVRSGVMVRHQKMIHYNDLRSVNVVAGPLLSTLGLRSVRGFTDSPEQISITSSREGGTRTVHRPDLRLVVETGIANQIAERARIGDVQKVQHVTG